MTLRDPATEPLYFTEHLPPLSWHDLDENFPAPGAVNVTEPAGTPAPVLIQALLTVAVHLVERPALTELGLHDTEAAVGCL